MAKYKHIYFDLDRTLWDYKRNASDTIRYQLLNHECLKSIHFDEFYQWFDKYNEEGWASYSEGKIKKEELRIDRFIKTFNHFGIMDFDFAEKISKEFIAICPTMPNLIEGTMEVLEYLKSKKYHLHILTNGFSDIQYTKIRCSKIEHFFTNVITSDEAHCSKPSKEIFHLAVSSLNAKKDTVLMVGDDYRNDIEGAMQYGIDQVWLNSSAQIGIRNPTFEIKKMIELKRFL